MALAIGCGDDGSGNSCKGSVTTVTPGAAGAVSIAGSFSEGHPIIEIVQPNGDHMDYPAANYDNTTAMFTNLPHGMFEVHWLLSCFSGNGQAVITGPSTMVTIP